MYTFFFVFNESREQHLQKKIEELNAEAKEKMKSNDKKGMMRTLYIFCHCLTSSSCFTFECQNIALM